MTPVFELPPTLSHPPLLHPRWAPEEVPCQIPLRYILAHAMASRPSPEPFEGALHRIRMVFEGSEGRG